MQFTSRFLTSAKTAGRLIIADGSDHATPEHQSWLRSYGDYFYAGPDIDFNRWWLKMVLAMDRVETPFAMVADNDDLLVPAGLDRCVDFLERHPDYIACSGRLEGFWCWPDEVSGPHFIRRRSYSLYDVPADYWQPTANQRVLAGFQNSWSFYAVYRTEALTQIRQEVLDIGFTDLQLHEKFCAMRALTLGKTRCFPDFASYLRQIGTSQTASTRTDWMHHWLRSNFSSERDQVLKRMALCDVEAAKLMDKWEEWYKSYFYRNFGPWAQFRRAAKKRLPWLADKVQNRHKLYPRWLAQGIQS